MAYTFPGDPPVSVSGSRKAEDHLNWLKDAVDAIETLQWFVRAALGDADGVLAYGTTGMDSMLVEQTNAPSMLVAVGAGAGFVDQVPFRRVTAGNSAAMVAPESEPRIDTIAVDAETGLVVVYKGEEAAVPEAPAVTEGRLKLAEVYHRVGETAIYDADTSGEGFITDARAFINA